MLKAIVKHGKQSVKQRVVPPEVRCYRSMVYLHKQDRKTLETKN
jgi:hypothetical protein